MLCSRLRDRHSRSLIILTYEANRMQVVRTRRTNANDIMHTRPFNTA